MSENEKVEGGLKEREVLIISLLQKVLGGGLHRGFMAETLDVDCLWCPSSTEIQLISSVAKLSAAIGRAMQI